MTVASPKRHSKLYWKPIAFVIGVGAFCVLAALLFGDRPHSPASTESSTETVTISVPTNSIAPAGTVQVAIPTRVLDKLGPSHEGGTSTTAVALIALVGSLVAAVLTYLATRDKNRNDRTIADEIRTQANADRKDARKEALADRKDARQEAIDDRMDARRQAIADRTEARDQATADRQEARQQAVADRTQLRRQEIRDHSLAACLELLKAGRAVLTESRLLWTACANNRQGAVVEESFNRLDPLIRAWHSAYEVLLLRVPPAAEETLIAYREALNACQRSATQWKDDYLASLEPAAPDKSTEPTREHSAENCTSLESLALAKREDFVNITKAIFREGAWSDT